MRGESLGKPYQLKGQNPCYHYRMSACILFIISRHNVSDLMWGEATRGNGETWVLVLSLPVIGLPWWLSSKESACNSGGAGDVDLTPGSGRSAGGDHGNPLQYSCLGNPMDRGAWWATVHGAAKSQTRLKRLSIIEPGLWEKSLDFPVSVSLGFTILACYGFPRANCF